MMKQEIVEIIVGILYGLCLPAALFYFFDPYGIFKRRRLEKTENESYTISKTDQLKEPTIIKAPKLLPTTCERCGCEYQAQQKHIRVSYTLGDRANERMYPKSIRVTDCPLCGKSNPVIFLKNEESEVKADEGYSIPKTDQENR